MSVCDIFRDGSCIGFYKFDNTPSDSCGLHNAIFGGTELYDAGIHSRSDAAKIDSNSRNNIYWLYEFISRTELAQHTDMVSGYNTTSFSAWVKVTNGTDFIVYNTGGSTNGYAVGIKNLQLYVAIQNGDTLEYYTNTTLSLNTWYHLVFCFDATDNSTTIYLNGLYVDKFIPTITIGNRAALTCLGSVKQINDWVYSTFYDDDQEHFNDGLVDIYRVFNRVLTQEEVSFLYNFDSRVFALFGPSGSNTASYYDGTTWVQVTSDRASLTEDDFLTYGHELPVNFSKTVLEQLDPNQVDILLSSPVQPNVNIEMNPVKQLIVQTTPTNLTDINTIDQIVVTTNGTGDTRFVLSRDSTNWYTWDGTSWVLVSSSGLDPNNRTDVDNVYNNGLSETNLETLTWDEIKLLYEDNGYVADKLAFAFVINDPTISDDLRVSDIIVYGQTATKWQDDTTNHVIQQTVTAIYITFNSDGTYKVNYMD